MNEIGEVFITIAFLVMIGVVLLALIISGPTDSTEQTVETIHCEHEYITTSEYNWFLGSYRTFSKCTKCGEEF